MNPSRRDSLPVLVAEEIRREILRGGLKPGAKLPSETELARTLAIGRPTVREALRILEGERWVQFRFSGGAYVADEVELSRLTSAPFRKDELFELLQFELEQLQAEGVVVPESLCRRISRLRHDGDARQLEECYGALTGLQQQPAFPYDEPSDLASIERSLPPEPFRGGAPLKPAEWARRIHGAWLGRCIGCLLGKPVEGWPHEEIRKYLQATRSFPLHGYIPYDPDKVPGADHSLSAGAAQETLGNIHGMPRDDDIDYTILNLNLLSKYGLEFTTEEVAEEWLNRLPYKMTYSAERQAYANLVAGLSPPATAFHRNPFREWIGATIRADAFGFVAPGDWHLASRLAYRDARLSHTKNGIYGEMFVAAVISAAISGRCPRDAISSGLACIPKGSRLAELVAWLLTLRDRTHDWLEAFRQTRQRVGRYNNTHALKNIAVILLAVLYGEMDFRKTVTIAVMCGWDTDCNGATAGSIAGAVVGPEGIPADMADPLEDRVRSAVADSLELRVSDLARRSAELAVALARSREGDLP